MKAAPWCYTYGSKHFWASKGVKENLGLLPIEPIKIETLMSGLPPDELQEVREILQHPENGKEIDFIYKLGPSEKQRYMHLRAQVFFDDSNHPEQLVGSLEDVTEKKKREDKHAFEEALFTTAMESHLNGMLILDNDGVIMRYNSRFLEIFKIPDHNLQGQKLLTLVKSSHSILAKPQDFFADAEEIARHREAETLRETELTDGRFLEVYSKPYYFGGHLAGRVLSFRDVSDKRQKNILIKNSEEKYKTLFESSADGILVLDLMARKAIDCNHQMLYLFKASRAEILEGNTLTFSPEYQPDGLSSELKREKFFKLDIHNLDMKRFDWQYQSKDGLVFDAEVIVSPFYLQGRPMAIHIIRDISRRMALREALKLKNNELEAKVEERTQHLKESNELLKRSNDDLEQFAFAASHDLKEPLRMVGNFVGLLARDYEDQLDKKAHTYIQFASDGVKRMTDLMKGLLEFSLMGRSEMNIESTDLNKLISLKILDLSMYLEEKGAIIHLPDTSVKIPGEPVMLGILFHNLISNAIKFNTNKNPEVWIDYQPNDKSLEITLKDNGIGIPPENQQKIFEIFTRLNRPNQFEGTGIGLAMCRKIVHRHGGDIWVCSEEGKGSTFYVKLPMVQEENDECVKKAVL